MGRKASFNFSMSSRSPEEQAAIKAKLAAINSKFSGKVSTTENVNRQINVKLGLGTSSASASNRESSEYFKDGSPKRDMMSPRRDNTPGSNQNTSDRMAKRQDAQHALNAKRSSDARGKDPATQVSAQSPLQAEIQRKTAAVSGARTTSEAIERVNATSRPVSSSSLAALGSPVGDVGTKSVGPIDAAAKERERAANETRINDALSEKVRLKAERRAEAAFDRARATNDPSELAAAHKELRAAAKELGVTTTYLQEKIEKSKSRKASSGGGGGDQPRVPAGSPDGGQWTK